jgi:RNA polymerase sigma factor (sigma-70 family)
MDHRGALPEVLRELAGRQADERPDRALLGRFVDASDEDAFAVLVRRHGPLVWGVCRRVLRHAADAEDAFQATFLVLARGAASVRRRDSLRCWLYGVALRVALRARRRVQPREVSEAELPARADDPVDAAVRSELTAVLDEEIRRLPERYRLPLVLCYLLGRTNDEAAGELGCPRGTIAVRLARGREHLRRRLLRRGLGPAATLAALPAGDALPRGLVPATRTAVAVFAADRATAGPAFTLANGVWTNMFYEKCKKALLCVLAVGLIGPAVTGGRALIAREPPAPETTVAAAPLLEKKPEPTPADERTAARLHNLLAERLTAAKTEYQAIEEQFIAGRGLLGNVIDAAQHLLRSDLELAKSKERRVAVREEHVARLKRVLDINVARFNAGRCSIYDMNQSRFHYLDACIEVEREKAR